MVTAFGGAATLAAFIAAAFIAFIGIAFFAFFFAVTAFATFIAFIAIFFVVTAFAFRVAAFAAFIAVADAENLKLSAQLGRDPAAPPNYKPALVWKNADGKHEPTRGSGPVILRRDVAQLHLSLPPLEPKWLWIL